MKITIMYNEETQLIDIITTGGTLSVNQTEAGALYLLLRKALGFKGRLKLRMLKKRIVPGL